MSEQELIAFFGKAILENWKYLISGLLTLFAGCVGLSWLIANLLHKKEIRVLELELSHQKEQFSQFESIMEQRIQVMTYEAELLQAKLAQKAESANVTDVGITGVSKYLTPPDGNQDHDSSQMVAEPKTDYKTKLSELIEKTDLVNHIIRTLNLLY